MSLSRNFYDLNEVQAALLYTTTRNNCDEALFWCKELIHSGCIGETISILFQSWLWHNGPYRLQWLIDAWNKLRSEELTEQDILLATYQLCKISSSERDNSLWNILVLGSKDTDCADCPDRVTNKIPIQWTKYCDSNGISEINTYFIQAIYQGKARSAWWISRYMTDDKVWELLKWFSTEVYTKYTDKYYTCLEALKGYGELLGYESEEYNKIIKCSCILMLCIQPTVQVKSFSIQADKVDDMYLCDLDKRHYSIPLSCLYGTTRRGCMKWSQSTTGDLYDIEKSLCIKGCPFWEQELEKYGIVNETSIKWNSDEDMEKFYDAYFPNDIPDEWTKKEKEKSHGFGVLGPNEKINIKKYSFNYLSDKSRLAWNCTKEVSDILETYDIHVCSLEKIIGYYKPACLDRWTQYDIAKLNPVKKIKRI
jgi:hypothetical protein